MPRRRGFRLPGEAGQYRAVAVRAADVAASVSDASTGLLGQVHRSEEHTSELQSPCNLVCRLLLEKKNLSYVAEQTAPVTSPCGTLLIVPARLHLQRVSHWLAVTRLDSTPECIGAYIQHHTRPLRHNRVAACTQRWPGDCTRPATLRLCRNTPPCTRKASRAMVRGCSEFYVGQTPAVNRGSFFFFLTDPAPPEIYTLPPPDAFPI